MVYTIRKRERWQLKRRDSGESGALKCHFAQLCDLGLALIAADEDLVMLATELCVVEALAEHPLLRTLSFSQNHVCQDQCWAVGMRNLVLMRYCYLRELTRYFWTPMAACSPPPLLSKIR